LENRFLDGTFNEIQKQMKQTLLHVIDESPARDTALPENQTIDPELKEELKSLGYL